MLTFFVKFAIIGIAVLNKRGSINMKGLDKRLISLVLLSAMLTSCGSSTVASSMFKSTEQDVADDVSIGDTTTTQAQRELSTGYVLTNGEDYIELYQAVEGSVVARMYQGEPITIYNINGEWAAVTYGGIKGYMKLVNISFTKPEEQTEATTEITTVEITTVATTQAQIVTQASTLATTQATQAQVQAQAQPVQNIEQNVNVNITFLSDDDGFQYAAPKSYPEYVSESGTSAWCSAKSIYIYAEPSTSSKKREADMLYYGDTCTILGTVGEWYYIGTDSGSGYTLHGYVKKSYITIGSTPKDPEPVGATQGKVIKNSANVRSSPDKSTDSNVLFTVHEGDTFKVLDYVNNYWYYIDYNGTKCYISHKMVEVW